MVFFLLPTDPFVFFCVCSGWFGWCSLLWLLLEKLFLKLCNKDEKYTHEQHKDGEAKTFHKDL